MESQTKLPLDIPFSFFQRPLPLIVNWTPLSPLFVKIWTGFYMFSMNRFLFSKISESFHDFFTYKFTDTLLVFTKISWLACLYSEGWHLWKRKETVWQKLSDKEMTTHKTVLDKKYEGLGCCFVLAKMWQIFLLFYIVNLFQEE